MTPTVQRISVEYRAAIGSAAGLGRVTEGVMAIVHHADAKMEQALKSAYRRGVRDARKQEGKP